MAVLGKEPRARAFGTLHTRNALQLSFQPLSHWKSTTFAAGLLLSWIAAPLVLEGPINRGAFQTYLDRVLISGFVDAVRCDGSSAIWVIERF